MKIILYVNMSDKHTVNKTLSDAIELEGSALRDESNNIETPTIRIVSDAKVFQYNYAYIEDFGRYYWFTTPVTIIRNGVYELNLESDPLMSFKEDFLQNSGYIETSKQYGNFYLDDGNMPIQQNTKLSTVKSYPSASPFTGGSSIVMNVLGLTSSYNFTTD